MGGEGGEMGEEWRADPKMLSPYPPYPDCQSVHPY